MNEKNRKLFATPFSAEYWRLSAGELKSTRVLVLAALLTALRIAIKSLKIPIGPNLTITFWVYYQRPWLHYLWAGSCGVDLCYQ